MTMNKIDATGYPLPIYVAVQGYYQATDTANRFRSGMRFFTTILKYCSITVVADYLYFLENGGKPDAALTQLLYANLFRPSLGHWNHFLRELLLFRRKTDPDAKGFFAEMDSVYFKKKNKTKPNRLAVLFNDLISIRNEWFHPGIDPDEKNAPGLVDEVNTKLAEIMQILEFLKNYDLFHIHGDNKARLMSSSATPWTENDVEKLETLERQLFLDSGDGRKIPLNFLIELKNSQSNDEQHFMLFETARINKNKAVKLVKFILGNQWGFDERLYLDLISNVQELLKIEQKKETVPTAEITWPHLFSVSQNLLRENRKSLEDSGKVIPSLYIPRSKIEGDDGIFEQFINAEKSRCLMILGDSGHGKTNTMWKLITHPELRSKKNDVALFFLEARNIHPQGFAREIDQALFIEGGLAAVTDALQKQNGSFAGKQLVCFIDAVNEYFNPAGLVSEILGFVHEQNPHFRVVLSCRTIAWSRILVNLSNQQEELIFSIIEDTEKKYPSLAVYSKQEQQQAFEVYRKNYHIDTKLEELSALSVNLLRDPLMLRLTAEAYIGKENQPGKIPRQLNIAAIFQKYDIKAHIDPQRDEPFLDELISEMWEHCDSSLNGTIIRQNDLLQEITYASPVNIVPGSTCVCDGCKSILIVGEQNFELGDPCPICDSMSIKTVQKDWRTTYERLLDEGIITEDQSGDDFALRFVYDRYFEYRTAFWLLHSNPAMTTSIILDLLRHAQKGNSPILLEALKLAIRMSENNQQIILELAASSQQSLMNMAESIIIDLANSEAKPVAEQLIIKLTGSSPQQRILVINTSPYAGEISDISLLQEIPKKEGNEIISAAISKAMYLIYRQDQKRAADLMEKMAESISATKITKHGPARFMVMLEVTFKTLGILHNDMDVVQSLGSLWVKIINHNLGLGRTKFPFKLISSSLRWTLINVVSIFASAQFKRHGVAFGKEDNAFTETEKKAVMDMMEAWEPGSETIEQVSKIMLNLGLNASDENQRQRICANLVAFFSIPACVAAMSSDPLKTIKLYDQTFRQAEDLFDQGRATRFFTYSGVNFALQLNYPKMLPESGEHPLEPIYDYMHKWLLYLLDNDPEIFAKAEIIEGTTNSSFGINMQAVTRMGKDLIEEIVKPMLATAKQGNSDLLKAFLRTSLFCLDTFSQRVSAHISVLRAFEYITNIPDLAVEIGLDESQFRQLFVEAYAVISLGFPTDTELFVVENKKLPQGFLEMMRQTRSQNSILFDLPTKTSLEQFVNKTLQGWTISDGGNSLLAHFPPLRKVIVSYFQETLETGDLGAVVKKSIIDLLNYLLAQNKK
jgi:hypothetical protein